MRNVAAAWGQHGPGAAPSSSSSSSSGPEWRRARLQPAPQSSASEASEGFRVAALRRTALAESARLCTALRVTEESGRIGTLAVQLLESGEQLPGEHGDGRELLEQPLPRHLATTARGVIPELTDRDVRALARRVAAAVLRQEREGTVGADEWLQSQDAG